MSAKPVTKKKWKVKAKKTMVKAKGKFKDRKQIGYLLNTLPGGIRCPFPPRLRTVMVFGEQTELNQAVAGVGTAVTYRANSPYDPRVAVGGNSAKWFDTFLGANNTDRPYQRYRVISTKINIAIFNQNTAAGTGNIIVGCYPRTADQAIITYDMPKMLESPMGTFTYAPMANAYKPVRFSHKMNQAQFLGIKDLADVSSAEGTYNSNPGFDTYYDLVVQAVNPASTASVFLMVNIEYYVELFSMNQPTSS